jgi:LacI family transcriptional regulator
VSIVSFDGLDITEFSDPAVTAVYQPGYQLGQAAARLLLRRINGMTGPARKIVLATELKIRNSVASVAPNEREGKPALRTRNFGKREPHVLPA